MKFVENQVTDLHHQKLDQLNHKLTLLLNMLLPFFANPALNPAVVCTNSQDTGITPSHLGQDSSLNNQPPVFIIVPSDVLVLQP